MNMYSIKSFKSGICYGEFVGLCAQEAIDAAARSAGLSAPFARNLYATDLGKCAPNTMCGWTLTAPDDGPALDVDSYTRAADYVTALSGGADRFAGP